MGIILDYIGAKILLIKIRSQFRTCLNHFSGIERIYVKVSCQLKCDCHINSKVIFKKVSQLSLNNTEDYNNIPRPIGLI